MLVKVHKAYRNVVAVCDSALIGKKFVEGNKLLDVNNFYNGDEIGSDEIVELLREYAMEDATFNIVGKESVNAALSAGIIDQEGIGTVDGVLFALVLM